MTQRKYGRIVNVSSVTGPLVSNRGSAAYGAAKAAMDGMMRAVALETALDGITINAVAPGWICNSLVDRSGTHCRIAYTRGARGDA